MDLGIGFGEVLLVLVVALIIWGPGKLPEIARTLGKTVRALRKASSDFTSTITREIEKEEKTSRLPEPEKTHLKPKADPSPGTLSSREEDTPPPSPEKTQP